MLCLQGAQSCRKRANDGRKVRTCREKSCHVEAEEIVRRINEVADAGCEGRPVSSRVSHCDLSQWLLKVQGVVEGEEWENRGTTSEELGHPRDKVELEGPSRKETLWVLSYCILYVVIRYCK